MKRLSKITIVVAIGVMAGVLGYHFNTKAVADDPLIPTEGIPLTFDLVEANCTSSGATLTYRSRKFELTLADYPWLMNDPQYPGKKGMHGDVTWINLPSEDYTITIFPGNVTEATPIEPPWEADVLTFTATHPEVHVVTASQRAGLLVNGQFVELGHYHVNPAPSPECDVSASWQPTVIEFRLELTGDMVGFQPPATIEHFVYRVRMSQN